MSIARYYIKNEKWMPAINRLKIIVENYDKTIFIEEASISFGRNLYTNWFRRRKQNLQQFSWL